MHLAEAEEIFAYWERHPPTYQAAGIIAQFLGWKPRPAVPAVAAPAPAGDLAALSVMPGMVASPLPDWARGAVVDFEQIRRTRLDDLRQAG